MGKICTCNDLTNENLEEFYGFNNKESKKNRYIMKKNFDNYKDEDKIFYEKTEEYDKIIKDKVNDGNETDNEPKEYINGTVKIIRI